MTLAAWIDPTDDNVRTEAGGRITDIVDKSVVGNDVSEPGTQGPAPATINGLTVGDFNGAAGRSDGLETVGNYTFTGPDVTVIAAYTDTGSTAGTAHNCIASAGDEDGNPGWALRKPFAGSAVGFSVNGQTATIAGSATSENIDIIVGKYNATQDFLEVIKNGGALQNSADATVDPTLTFQLAWGTNDTTNAGWEWGEVGDVVVFDGAMRYDQIQRVEGYLAHKYDAQAALPDGHPFKAIAPDAVVDAEFLANFIGADGATAYTAESGQSGTFAANAQISESGSKYYGTGLLLDGVGDQVSFGDSVDFELGAGDFTIEAWCAPDTATPSEYDVCSKYDANTSDREWIFGLSGSGELRFSYDTGAGASSVTATSNDAPTLIVDEMIHIAVCRQGNNLYGFINGTRVTFVSNDDMTGVTINNSVSAMIVGNRESGSGEFGGVIDSVRLIKGKALYQQNFNVPRRAFRLPLAAQFLANFNGPDAAVAYTSEDGGARVGTFLGNAQIDTAQHMFGHSALLCDGTGDAVSFPDSADWDLADNDFEIQAWVRFNSLTGVQTIVSHWDWNGLDDNGSWILRHDHTGNNLQFVYSTTGANSTTINNSWTPAANTWYHVMVSRFGDVLYFHIDGLNNGTAALTATLFSAAALLYVGGWEDDTNPTESFDGWIDSVSIANGRALRFPIVPDQLAIEQYRTPDLLILFDGVDAATSYSTDDINNSALTFTNAELDDTERYIGATSAWFSALSERITVDSADAPVLGTGDFTIEMWLRPDVISGNQIFYDQRTVGNQETPSWYFNGSGFLLWFVNNVNQITGTIALAADTWHHVAICRANGVTTQYVDGVADGSFTDTFDYIGNDLNLGNYYASNSGLRGWMDGVRVFVGEALYGGDFDPPVSGMGEPII